MKRVLQIAAMSLLCLVSTVSMAQNGVFDVRFRLNEQDCDNSKLFIDIEIKANSASTTYNVSEQNYRFSFNRNALANPVIIQELTLSGFVSTTSPASTSFYSPHTLTGSIDTVVSYNVELAGGDGYPLEETTWVKAGRIGFDILDVDECFELEWHTQDPDDFPPTFIGEKFNNSLFAVDEGTYGNVGWCFADSCNTPPIAVNDTLETDEDVAIVSYDITTNDIDAEGNIEPASVTFIGTLPPTSQGAVANNGDGTITFTPASGFTGVVDPFDYAVCDTDSECDTATVFITVNPINDPPVANNDNATTPEDTPVTLDIPANDTDSDGNIDPTTVTLVSTPPASEGTVTVNPTTGVITFTPAPNFNGPVTPFDYQVCDDGTPLPAQCDVATVNITVTPVNDPPVANDDNATTPEDTPVNVNIPANDTDIDGNIDPTSVTLLSTPPASEGTVSVNPTTGVITFTPAPNFNGPVTPFDYQVCDDGTPLPAQCDVATVTITVTPENDPPVAVDDSGTTDEDTPITINIPANDSDVDGNIDPTSVTLISTPPASEGTVSVNPTTGAVTFTPAPGFNGPVTPFDYQICDDGTPLPAQCDIATVTINVSSENDPPVANDDMATTNEDVAVTVNVPTNDTDSDGNIVPSTVTLITSPPASEGVATVNPVTGLVTFTPAPGFNGPVTPFTYQICDDGTPLPSECDQANVIITVLPINDAPTANNDNGTTPEDTPITINIPANDTDTDGNIDPTSVTIITPPPASQGTVSVDPTTGALTFTPAPGFNGPVSPITYEICDDGTPLPAQCDQAVVTINVTPVNDPPVAVDDSETTNEDTPVNVTVIANDSDTDGNIDPTSITLVSTPPASEGTVTVNPTTGVITFTPAPDFNGPVTPFDYQVCDDGTPLPAQCDIATVTITVTPDNDPPVAVDDTGMTDEDIPVTINIPANDSDVDGNIDPPSVTILSTPPASEGTVTVNPTTGEITFTPAPGFSGPVTPFDYQICDDGTPLPAECDVATVTITVGEVNDPPDAVDDLGSTNEDTPTVIDVTDNDTDSDGVIDPTTVVVTTPPPANEGTTTVDPVTGDITFTPAPDFTGTSCFNYQVCDDGTPVLCDIALVCVEVQAENDPPVAEDDNATTPEDTPVTVNVPANDTDTDGMIDPTTVTLTSTPPASEGTATVDPVTGQIIFVPAPDFNGPVTPFTYEICDDGTPLPSECDEATVNITVTPVNDPPVANNDDETTDEDTPVTIPVTGNDMDPDGMIDPTTVTITMPPAPTEGTVTVDPVTGDITFTPAPDVTGTVCFSYQVCDDGTPVLCDDAVVCVEVEPVNDPPTANDDNGTTPEDTPVTLDIPANDTDDDGNIDPTSVTIVTPPPASQGTVSVDPTTGEVTFTPAPDFNGPVDPITYEICDDGTPLPAQCDQAEVNITVTPVNDPPVANDDSNTTPEDTPVTTPVTDNDTDLDGNIDPTSVTVTGPPPASQGTVSVDPVTGDITFTPAPDFNGPVDPITYQVCDDGTPLPAECDEATLNITVAQVNDPPTANDDNGTTPEDTPVTLDIPANDTDNDGMIDPTTVTIVTPPPASQGTLTVDPTTGEVTFTPAPNFFGPVDAITYEICDDGTPVQCDQADINIIVTPVNDPPIAEDDSVMGNEDDPVVVPVVDNDSDPLDPNGAIDPTTVTVTTPPPATEGTVTVDPVTGDITFTPTPGFSGESCFTYEVCDNGVPAPVLCDQAEVCVTVDALNDAPEANDDTNTTPEDTPVTTPVTANDTDTDGNIDPTTVTIVTPPPASQGTVTVDPVTGDITFTPAPDFNGPVDPITYQVCDDGTPLPAECDQADLNITVTPENDPPVANDDSNMTPEETPVTTPVTGNDTDIDGNIDPTSVTIVTPPPASQGTVTVDPTTGDITFTPAPDFNGPVDPITYQVCDDGTPLPAQCDEADLNIVVDPLNDPPVANDDLGSTTEDTPTVIDVTDNDTDLDGNIDPTTVVVTNPPPANEGTTMVDPVTGDITFTPAPDFNGTSCFNYQVCDDGTPLPSQCDDALVCVEVQAQNDPPTPADDSDTTPEDTPVTIDVPANDTDSDGNIDPTTVTIVTPPPANQGTVTVDPTTGEVTFTPAPDFNGPVDPITYEICDDGTPLPAECETAEINITVTPENDAPTANDDSELTNEDTPVTVPVTDNDTDDDGNIDPNSVTIVTPPPASQGTVMVDPITGDVTFTPAPDFNGPVDPITYQVCDDGTPLPAQCDQAEINITVIPNNDPPTAVDDSGTTPEDTPITLDIPANDTDDDGNIDPTTVTIITNPPTSQGTVAVDPTTGEVTFTPAPDFNGPVDPITYEICDDGTPLPAQCDQAVITITVTPENDPPTANDDSETTPEDTPVVVPVTGNDTDDDGNIDPGSVTIVTPPPANQGTVSVDPLTGDITFTPEPDYNGPVDPIVYEVCDDGTPLPAECDQATINITVIPQNDPPTAVDDSDSTPEDTPVTIDIPANDTDDDGNIDPTSVTILTNPPLSQGTISVDPTTGEVTFTPAPNFNGPVDPITYEICDDGTPLPAQCDQAVITITVDPVNDPPVANDDDETVPEDNPVTIDVTNNDTDPDGNIDPTTVTVTTPPPASEGTVTVDPVTGDITFTPAQDFTGESCFTYEVCDDGNPAPVLCDDAEVCVDVTPQNDPPIAVDDNDTTPEDTPVTIPALSNDSDPDGALNPITTAVIMPPPINEGTVIVNPATGDMTFTPAPDFTGTSCFMYQICDNGIPAPVLCDQAQICVDVTPVNDPPVANDDNETTDEDTPVTVNIPANDTDSDGNIDPTTVTLVSTPPASEGTVSVDPTTGAVTFTPAPDFNGPVTPFTYEICDDGTPLPAQCDQAEVTITVNPINDPPVAGDDNATTPEDTPVSVNLPGNDTDTDGNIVPSSVTLVSLPPASEGTVTLNPVTGQLTFTPAPNFTGPVTPFDYQICDDGTPLPVQCDVATVTITVTPENDAPMAVDDNDTTPEDTPVTVPVTGNDTDTDGNIDPTTVTLVSTPPASQGTVSVDPTTGDITFTPAPDFNGPVDPFTYQVCDDGTPLPAQCDQAEVNITVDPVNDPPTAVDDTDVTEEDTPVSIPVPSNDTDTDGNIDPTTVTIVTPPPATEGTVSVNPATGDIVFTPAAGYTGTSVFTYQVCDDGTPLPALCDDATVTVTIVDCPDPMMTMNPTSVCLGESGTFMAQAAGPTATYTWNFGAGATPATATGLGPHDVTYSTPGAKTAELSITENGCTRSIGENLTVYTFPSAQIVQYPLTVCVNELELFAAGIVQGSGATYEWDFGGADANPATANGVGPHAVSFGDPGLREIRLVVTRNGCSDTTFQSINVTGGAIADAGVDTTVCEGTSIQLGGVPQQPGATYIWSPSTNLIPPNAAQPIATPVQTTSYTLFVIQGSCTTFSDVTVTVDIISVPFAEAGSDKAICEGDAVQVGGSPTGAAGSTYSWTPAVGIPAGQETLSNPTVNPTSPTIYTVAVSRNGCTKLDMVEVDVTQAPQVDAGPDETICLNEGGVEIGGSPTGASSAVYQWSPAIGLNSSTVANPIANPIITTTYTVTVQRNGCTATENMTVTVETCNNPPLAIDDINNTLVDVPVDGQVLTNDSDPDNDNIILTTMPTSMPTNGTVVLNANGTYTYTPNPGYDGEDEFDYEICDSGIPSECDTATVVITITPIPDGVTNFPPVANNDQAQTFQNVPVNGNMLINDFDPDGDAITVNTTPIANPTNGTVTINANGTYVYTPATGFTGEDTFEYEICDGISGCDIATVTITILPPPLATNSPPFAADDAVITPLNTPVTSNVLPNDVDPNNDPITVNTAITPISGPTNGTVTPLANGDFTYTPNDGYFGPDQFVYEVCDGISGCDQATVYITVLPPVCIDIQVAVWLEGTYDTNTGIMNTHSVTTLNNRGVLPGQTPINPLVSGTPAGHPYNAAPWNHTGTEGDNFTDADYDAIEAANGGKEIVDWVLVRFRTGIANSTEVAKVAGLLLNDGTVVFVDPCVLTTSTPGPLYVVIDHRNHMGVMNQNPVTLSSGSLIVDFRNTESYITGTGFGQKQITPGVYVMYAGDGDQAADFPSYDITGVDKILWTIENGEFDQYRLSDFNMDGDVTGADKILWSNNNGISSRVPK